jgi:hypothetical protein
MKEREEEARGGKREEGRGARGEKEQGEGRREQGERWTGDGRRERGRGEGGGGRAVEGRVTKSQGNCTTKWSTLHELS